MDPAQAFEASMLTRQQAMNDAIARGDSHIQQFYANTTILLTGATGFIGKQLLEKLLRSCKDIKKVFVLMRSKKEKPISERLDQLIKDPVYEELSKKYPNFGEKIFAVEGDVTQIKLGINDEDWKTITDEVNIIFHAAATINFDEPIKVATLTNVRGTREMLTLAKECKNLRSVVHISTAYSHATKKMINCDVFEQFYPSPVPPDVLIQCAENVEERRLNNITENLIQDWPNTYTFTKAVAEELVRQASDLPVSIVRPAIVIGAFREPSPGWVDMNNVFGPSGVTLGVGLGAIHTILCNDTTTVDYVPVDVVNNAIIAAGWETAQRKADGEEAKIYTVARERNSVTIGDISQQFHEKVRPLASPKTLWYGFCISTPNKYIFLALTWLLHYIPALIVDTIARILGKKPRLLKIYKKAFKLSTVISYFILNNWKFIDDNLYLLYKNMSKTDQDIYNFDITTVDLKDMVAIWHVGIRKYILKDGLKDTAYAVKKQVWFKIGHYVLIFLFSYVTLKMLYFLFVFCGHIASDYVSFAA